MEYRPASECIHCGKCKRNCDFLTKYGIDIGDTERLKELAYHCFLCGKCTAVCPIHIDGRGEVLRLRQEIVNELGADVIEADYKDTIKEKLNYKFRNYKHAKSGAAFFPGCNFPSLYPKTCKKLVEIFNDFGISTIYDCCGKPIGELGLKKEGEDIFAGIRKRLAENGIDELILACPNCRDYFGDNLGVKITSAYTKLTELGIGNTIDEDIAMFVPCPDRINRIWIEELKPFIKGEITIADGAQCCGLGGNAMKLEPEIAKGFANELIEKNDGVIYTYCASCTGRFKRSGVKDVRHVMSEILGTHERADTGKSYLNRMMTKYK